MTIALLSLPAHSEYIDGIQHRDGPQLIHEREFRAKVDLIIVQNTDRFAIPNLVRNDDRFPDGLLAHMSNGISESPDESNLIVSANLLDHDSRSRNVQTAIDRCVRPTAVNSYPGAIPDGTTRISPKVPVAAVIYFTPPKLDQNNHQTVVRPPVWNRISNQLNRSHFPQVWTVIPDSNSINALLVWRRRYIEHVVAPKSADITPNWPRGFVFSS